ncbi:MAG: hypothetical protein WBA74_04295 [Cyclobacteriaceae bacterium]
MKDKLKYPLLIVISILLTPLIYHIWIRVALYLVLTADRGIDFDSEVWKSNSYDKVYMVDDIIESEMFIGKPSSEALNQLGKPNYGDTINNLGYFAGKRTLGFRIHGISLELLIKNDTVVIIEQFAEDMD